MPIALITPATALAAALLLPAGGPAPAQFQLAVALQPTTPAKPPAEIGRQEPRPGAPIATHPEAPIETLKAPPQSKENSLSKGDALGVNAPVTKSAAPLSTLGETSRKSDEGLHKTPTSLKPAETKTPKGG